MFSSERAQLTTAKISTQTQLSALLPPIRCLAPPSWRNPAALGFAPTDQRPRRAGGAAEHCGPSAGPSIPGAGGASVANLVVPSWPGVYFSAMVLVLVLVFVLLALLGQRRSCALGQTSVCLLRLAAAAVPPPAVVVFLFMRR